MAQELDLDALWQQVNEALRRGPINRALWEAAAAAKPLIIENDTLVVGFNPKDMRHASYLETTVNKNRIQEILQARTTQRLDLRCIEGDTLAAWEHTKERDAAREAKSRAGFEAVQAHRGVASKWEEFNQELIRFFAAQETRRTATRRARLLIKAMPMVAEKEAELRNEDPEAVELHERELNRVFEKIATQCDLPATQVALEYLRYKGSRKAG